MAITTIITIMTILTIMIMIKVGNVVHGKLFLSGSFDGFTLLHRQTRTP